MKRPEDDKEFMEVVDILINHVQNCDGLHNTHHSTV